MVYATIFANCCPASTAMSVQDCTIFDTPYRKPPPKKLPMLTYDFYLEVEQITADIKVMED